jgi:hypothetical protein
MSSHFTEAGWISEQMGGIDYLFFLRELAKQIENDWDGVRQKLEAVRAHLINRGAMLVNVTLDADNWAIVQPRLTSFLDTMPNAPVTMQEWTHNGIARHEGLSIPAQVNYVGKAANLYELGYELDGSINPIVNFVRTTWLWERVRMQGGAYGGFAVFNANSGVFAYASYRDPNLLGTLDNYDKTADFLANLDLNDHEITKSIIGSIGDMDRYQLPDAKGFSSMQRYLIGYTDDMRQQIRDEILNTKADDFKRFADTLRRLNANGQVVAMGSAQNLREANETLTPPLEIVKVM